ncbi:hypothetical protein ACOSQ4_009163 [Xanthoceras sorbifolium]
MKDNSPREKKGKTNHQYSDNILRPLFIVSDHLSIVPRLVDHTCPSIREISIAKLTGSITHSSQLTIIIYLLAIANLTVAVTLQASPRCPRRHAGYVHSIFAGYSTLCPRAIFEDYNLTPIVGHDDPRMSKGKARQIRPCRPTIFITTQWRLRSNSSYPRCKRTPKGSKRSNERTNECWRRTKNCKIGLIPSPSSAYLETLQRHSPYHSIKPLTLPTMLQFDRTSKVPRQATSIQSLQVRSLTFKPWTERTLPHDILRTTHRTGRVDINRKI